ncbi:DUF2628 domain-containing protein [Aminobacter anthyllidis]|uniref:DUF2628 domain-containing protein n=1 Tax=Aminobacter anthyllidis TaxID=1035067 RepID=A0A9X1AGB2_9HYPH|nr:DUF2628 domain-containing protein [Aminobacter anthyllidis]MBT1159116.1 DUF2628 domain-containing protein [Aminobacter anthyllidis]MDH4987101.1 DUF2628 domain-containing protein [Aminobacter anthyllidis]
MAIHVVMEPPASAGKNASEAAVFVRDGFYVFGFVLPLLWLLWHRLWLEAAVTLAVTMALAIASEAAGLTFAAPLLPLLISLYVGLEGGALRVAALRRAGWRQWGVIEADTIEDAETRYLFADDLIDDEEPAPTVTISPATPRPQPAGGALGLLHYPGRN